MLQSTSEGAGGRKGEDVAQLSGDQPIGHVPSLGEKFTTVHFRATREKGNAIWSGCLVRQCVTNPNPLVTGRKYCLGRTVIRVHLRGTREKERQLLCSLVQQCDQSQPLAHRLTTIVFGENSYDNPVSTEEVWYQGEGKATMQLSSVACGQSTPLVTGIQQCWGIILFTIHFRYGGRKGNQYAAWFSQSSPLVTGIQQCLGKILITTSDLGERRKGNSAPWFSSVCPIQHLGHSPTVVFGEDYTSEVPRRRDGEPWSFVQQRVTNPTLGHRQFLLQYTSEVQGRRKGSQCSFVQWYVTNQPLCQRGNSSYSPLQRYQGEGKGSQSTTSSFPWTAKGDQNPLGGQKILNQENKKPYYEQNQT